MKKVSQVRGKIEKPKAHEEWLDDERKGVESYFEIEGDQLNLAKLFCYAVSDTA